MIVTFTPETTDLNYVDSENINLIISWDVSLTPEELLEPEPNTIVSKTANISPSTTNISIIENENDFTITGLFNLDDFACSIFYVDKGNSDKNQTPINVNKYGLVPDMKDVFKILPIESEKTYILNISLTDKNDVLYNKIYTINVKLKNNSVSNWTKNYFEERY